MDERTGLPVVGMVGGGQLARMTHQAAIALGQSLRVLSIGPDESAALVTPDVDLGSHTDRDALLAFAAHCDVVTFDHEHVPGEHIDALVAAGHKVFPGSAALLFAQDKAAMRHKLTALGAPVPRWTELDAADPGVATTELLAFGADVGWPLVLKATRGGYDGRGVWVVDSPEAAAEVVGSGTALLAEELVPLEREVAALVARSPFGQGAAYPVVETVQRDGICVEVIAPAPDLDPELAAEAEHLALRLAGELGVVGLLAVELFVTGGRLVVNELAMRPHNSGHWTMDGARTSQFEQHLRAVLDYPLGVTAPLAPWTVMANVIGAPAETFDDVDPATVDERLHHLFAKWPDVKVHLYGKQWKPGRKVGHVNALSNGASRNDLDDTRARARAAADYLMHGALMSSAQQPVVGLIMGSDSDWPTMAAAAEALTEFGVPFEADVVSAHRMPDEMVAYARGAAGRGLRVVIAGAGGAAHLPGMVASMTTLPVIGVPVPLKYLDGMDSLLSIVQMPAGIPVATVSIGGARNAGLLAVRILAAGDPELTARLDAFARDLTEAARAKGEKLRTLAG